MSLNGLVKKSCFVSGHRFSDAEEAQKRIRL